MTSCRIWAGLASNAQNDRIRDAPSSTQRIEACLLGTLDRSGLAPDEIDAVARTAGSAQIRRFVELLG